MPSVMGSLDMEARVGPNVPTLQSCAGLSGDEPPSWTTYRPTKTPLISTDSGVVEGGLSQVTKGAPLAQEIPRV